MKKYIERPALNDTVTLETVLEASPSVCNQPPDIVLILEVKKLHQTVTFPSHLLQTQNMKQQNAQYQTSA